MPPSLLWALVIGVRVIGPTPPAAPQPAMFSIELNWTAPGDDGGVGKADLYDLRVATWPITPTNFWFATELLGVPRPSPAGSRESYTVLGLESGTVYFFAIKSRDDAGNWSSLSNVVSVPDLTLGVGDLPAEVDFSAPWPNPARSAARWSYALPQAGEVRVEVFSPNGRRVREVASGWRQAGRGELTWDLRDQSGRTVPAGIYMVRAQLGGRSWTGSLAVVR